MTCFNTLATTPPPAAAAVVAPIAAPIIPPAAPKEPRKHYKRVPTDDGSYCHGYWVSKSHTSANCKWQKEDINVRQLAQTQWVVVSTVNQAHVILEQVIQQILM
jgi:hypothetical protein